MNIQIDGTNTRNKGAELMLYSVLEAIENKYPNSSVFFNAEPISSYKKIKTNLDFKRRLLLEFARYPKGVLRRLKLPYRIFTEFYPTKNIDLILDAGGFRFGDQWLYNDKYFDSVEYYYAKLKSRGTKIYFLPQAFGPFKTPSGKRSVKILENYADLIISRDSLSYKYIIDSGINAEKVYHYPDFTNLTKGIFPQRYSYLKKSVCIIPNNKMITHTDINSSEYLSTLISIIEFILKSGKEVFLLNHEGKDDLEICNKINNNFQNKLAVVDNLSAREIKGIIGSSYFTISSRFHGVASALNQSVPCLATSWSHKYEYLFKDFGLTRQIIEVNNSKEENLKVIERLINFATNNELRNNLLTTNIKLKLLTEKMWQDLWKHFEK